MKRRYVLILIMALVWGLSVHICAAENLIQAQYRYDGLQDALIVEGTVVAPKGNVWLTLDITGPDGQFMLGRQTVAEADNFNTELKFQFEPVYFGIDSKSGIYTLEVYGYQAAEPVKLSFEYAGVDVLFSAMKELETAVSSGSSSAVMNVIAEKAGELGVTSEDMQNLGSKGAEVFAKVVLGAEYNIPESIETDADKEQVKTAAMAFREAFEEGIAAGRYADIETVQDIKDWLDLYKDEYGLDKDDESTKTDEERLYYYVTRILDEPAFATRIAARKDLTTPEKIREALYEDALLTIIYKRHFSEAKEVIDEFEELFPVDRTSFGDLSATSQGKVYEEISGKNYADYAEVTEKFDDIVEDLSDVKTGGGGGGGGGGVSGGATTWGEDESSGGASVIISDSAGKVFSDLGNFSWAEEAILYLEGKDIVSGKEQGKFYPNDLVTRAEFTKMIVSALGVQVTGDESGFVDVASGAWYAPYISAAKNAGLVMGDEENRFNPDTKISREDMAAILYRACGIDDTGAELDFTDRDEISGYAAEAVGCFYSYGIISGVGDGRFAPKENATRAQAAVMIYNVLTKL